MAVGQNRYGIPFWGQVNSPPILEPILVGIWMFTGGFDFKTVDLFFLILFLFVLFFVFGTALSREVTSEDWEVLRRCSAASPVHAPAEEASVGE